MAPVKLLNIKPTIKIDMVSRSRLDTIKISAKTNKLPRHEAKIIPYEDNKNGEKIEGKNPAPKITNATPKLEPELKPRT